MGGGMRNGLCALAVSILFLAGCASTPHVAGSSEPVPPQQPAAQAEQKTGGAVQAEPSASETSAVQPGSRSLLSADALGIYRTPEEQQDAPTYDELAVLASAKTLIGMKPNAKVTVNGKPFVLDCIGTVSAIYYRLSLDVTKDFSLYTGNGVNRLYMTLKERNALHTDKYPRPGDVIIWDNTWDVKDDGDRIHDPRTHAGIVLAVDEDGTIHYVHENLYKGVMIETMNLLRPTVARDEQGKVLNSGMAIASKEGGPKPEHNLSGDVFDCFGDVLGVREYFLLEEARRDGDATEESAKVALGVEH
jgi:hypothetical protein